MNLFTKKTILLLVFLLSSFSIYAYDFEVDGIYYKILSVPNETCTVTKSPNQYEGVIDVPAEVQYAGRKFIVKEIDDYAFENNTGIVMVRLGVNIEEIGVGAFKDCINIETIVFDCENCKSAGSFEYPAFVGCRNITKIQFGGNVINIPKYLMKGGGLLLDLQLPDGIKDIGDYAFAGHSEILRIILPQTLEFIGDYAFKDCCRIKELFIPDNVIAIGSSAFSGCKLLNNIKFSKSLKRISNYAFSECVGIEKIDFTECNLHTIDSYAFYNCANLVEIEFSPVIMTIGDSSFKKCITLSALNIPETVTSIGNNAFANCTKLGNVKICNSSVTMGQKVFWGDSLLTKVDLGENVISIGKETFIGCNIETITIPNSVSKISSDIFDSSLKELIIADGDSILIFEMNKRQGETPTYYSFNSFQNKKTPHYVTYYEGVIAPAIEKLYLGRNIHYGPAEFYSSSQVQISSPIPNSVKTMTFGTGFTQLTKGFTVTSRIYYYANSSDAEWGSKSYVNCVKTKASIIPPLLEEIKIINQIPPKSYTDWVENKYTFPSNTNLFTAEQYKNVKLYIPAGCLDEFKTAEIWENFLWIIQFLQGDVNGDISVDVADVATIVAIILGNSFITDAADVNCDGSIDIADITEIVNIILNPDDSRAVDLGLSSGLKWASYNVGATKPEEYGGYYAWGETEEKSDYGWDTYKYCNGTHDSMTKYCTSNNYVAVDNKTTLEPADDVATVNWGGSWRMPTTEEQYELRDNCTWTWTTLNGVNGYRVTGPNGNSIFLPAAGYCVGRKVSYRGSYGCYWSSSLANSSSAYYLDTSSTSCGWGYDSRCYGRTVRPVLE